VEEVTRPDLAVYVERRGDWLWGGLGAIVRGKGGRQSCWNYILVPLDIDGTPMPRR